MSIVKRKARERAARYELILNTALELAAAEGWEAVTTRRLAALIQYSQPVLYSHFKGKAEIMAAIAMRGFEQLATELKNAAGSADALHAACTAYLQFAASQPVVYEAMFVSPTELLFASEQTPTALRDAFDALVTALGPDQEDLVFTAEVLWSALHGMVVLSQSKRLPVDGDRDRLDVLIRKFRRSC
ncbi:TetR/AcrR family transcriptional regulator (plasmid) [Paraburkholderia sp. PREW-6R]|uniref:TetR/AcrR family transcriptional regulator n=1 Tax=Paraburkholderia sp. PREW-6R TaxID=3141544 RepID=UPI0031F50547